MRGAAATTFALWAQAVEDEPLPSLTTLLRNVTCILGFQCGRADGGDGDEGSEVEEADAGHGVRDDDP